MQMAEGLDTGPVLLESRIGIDDRETTGALTERLAALGASAIVDALSKLDRLEAQAQDDSNATYAQKIRKPESRLDWRRSNTEIDRAVRAFNPAPGAETRLGDLVLKIWSAGPVRGVGKPGEVLECEQGRLVVGTGSEAIEVLEVQKPGGRRLSAAEFLRGSRLVRGAVFESEEPGSTN